MQQYNKTNNFYFNDDAEIEQYIPNSDIINDIVSLFAILGDYTRLRIISALSLQKMSVMQLVNTLKINQSTLSHQLRLLKDQGAVVCEKKGKNCFYSLKNKMINDILLKAVIYLGY